MPMKIIGTLSSNDAASFSANFNSNQSGPKSFLCIFHHYYLEKKRNDVVTRQNSEHPSVALHFKFTF